MHRYLAIPWPRLQRRIWRRILACHLCPCDRSWVLHIVGHARLNNWKTDCESLPVVVAQSPPVHEWRIWWAECGGTMVHCKKGHLPGRELLNCSRPGRVWLATFRLGTGKAITFFYSVAMGWKVCIPYLRVPVLEWYSKRCCVRWKGIFSSGKSPF